MTNRSTHPSPAPFSWRSFNSLLAAVNVASRDDGREWTDRTRLEAIERLLAGAPYRVLYAGPLSLIYAHRDFDPTGPVQLISTHADSVYAAHHCGPSPWAPETGLLGTFDNSITNAVTIDLMRRGALPAQTLAAFTGDEEVDSRGAREVMSALDAAGLRGRAEFIFVLDITGENPQGLPCTLENIFLGAVRPKAPYRALRSRKAFAAHLAGLLEMPATVVIHGAPDESWEYHKFKMTCVAFCIPVQAHPDHAGDRDWGWMHSEKGMLIEREVIPGYSAALSLLARRLL